MLDIRFVNALFAVAPQIAAEDCAAIAEAGYGAVVNNRPDEEIPGQFVHDRAQIMARKAGLRYLYLPIRTRPPKTQSAYELAEFLAQTSSPTLAWCRSGMRSIQVWAMAQVLNAALSVEEAIIIAAQAGYDLSSIRADLESLTRQCDS